jgi:hypothetical protein
MKVRSGIAHALPLLVLLALLLLAGSGTGVAKADSWSAKPDCADATLLCAEVDDWQSAFPYYVGHDEPATLFYSKHPGSGNTMRYQLTLPTDPPPTPIAGRSYNFMLHPAFWFGIAMCDTQSYPEQVSRCKPDSDQNITPLAQHAGTAFMELQFYPPGFVKQFTGFSCDAVSYCAALTIDSLAEDPVNGTLLNAACQGQILGGLEYVNFAYVTRTGVPQGPPNPKDFQFVGSGDPGPTVLYMHPGDHITVSLHDTKSGLEVDLYDNDTGQSGSMIASAANDFGQIKYAPTGSECTVLPYDFHPMYSTSSPQTRVPWAAHSYNVAFSDEIGHFDFCTSIAGGPGGSCNGQEGRAGDQEPADGDDNACFGPGFSTLVPVTGCLDTNAPGFDGMSYQDAWPDGNTNLHPTAVQFTSPLLGNNYNHNYDSAALEADLPRIEAADLGGSCDRLTGAGCTKPPPSDDGTPAAFYPFFSITGGSNCRWLIGNDVPGLTANDFGKINQYGPLYPLDYLVFGGHGAIITRYNNFQNALGTNPCPTG